MGTLEEQLLRQEEAERQGIRPPLALKEQDPVRWEVLYNRLAGLVQNSRETARRISASPVVKEMGECVFALFTPTGDSVCFSRGLLLHVVSMGLAIKWMIRNNYEETIGIAEGDYFFNNDPYIGGAHAPDQLIVTPIFSDGRIVGWAGGLTHVSEVGSIEPGGMSPSAQTRYDEGIYMPCVKVAEKEEIRRDLEIMVERGTRMPLWWLLDNRAKIAGSRLIREGVKALIAEYGLDYYLDVLQEYIEDTRKACRKRIEERLFPGRLRAVGWHGIPLSNQPVRYRQDHEIRLAVDMMVGPKGELTLDYEGTSPAGRHFNNATLPATQANVINTLIQYLFYDIKYNQGVMQAFELRVPPSTLNPPDLSYSCSVWTTAIIAASIALESQSRGTYAMGYREEVSGRHPVTGAGLSMGGRDQYGRPFAGTIFETAASGMGASAVMDGLDTAYQSYNAEGDCTDAEMWERLFPLMWLGRGINPDGGGLGKFRGGNGIESLHFVEHTDSIELMQGASGTVYSVQGLMGAYPASANYRCIVQNTDLGQRARGREPIPHREGDPAAPEWERLVRGTTTLNKAPSFATPMGRYDLWHQLSGSGGGFGDPIERDPKLVKNDVQRRLTSLRTAQEVYCVALDPQLLEVDTETTDRLRQERRRQRLARGIPAREYLAQGARLITEGRIPPVPRASLNQCLALSSGFLLEFRDFWDLPEDFTSIPDPVQEPTSAGTRA